MTIRISGPIPVRIYPIFWLLAFAIGWLSSSNVLWTFVWVGIILFSVLVHEFGHALTAKAFGQKVHIDLLGFGGLTHRHGNKLRGWQEFLIVLNGPLAGFGLSLLAWLFLEVFSPNKASFAWGVFTITLYANIFWTLVNLLPIQPLDGGKLLKILLEGAFGVKGLKISLLLSMVLGVAIVILSFAYNQFLMGILFMLLAFENYRMWQGSLALTEQDEDVVLQKLLKEAKDELRMGNPEDAGEKLQNVRAIAKSGIIYITASELLAELKNEQGDYAGAFELLEPLSTKLTPPYFKLLHQSAYRAGQWKSAVKLGERAYQESPGYETALINALSHALLAEVKPALGWLHCAIRDGLPNLRAILNKSEFDSIRNTPQFQELQKQIYETY